MSAAVVTKRIGDDELPDPHMWAVVAVEGKVYAFVKASASDAEVAEAQAVAERRRAEAAA
jgi:hypothetical protein